MIQDCFTDDYSKQGNRDKASSCIPTFQDLEKYLCIWNLILPTMFLALIRNSIDWNVVQENVGLFVA